MGLLYQFNFNGSSPFVIYDGSGNTIFDAAVPPLRVYMQGVTATIPHRTIDPLNLLVDLPEHGTDAFATITFGKTFAAPPQFCSLGYADHFYTVVATGLYAPMLMLQDFASGGDSETAYGMLASCYTDHLIIGNFDWQYSLTGHYLVFENMVNG